jgi:hypothetical protein
MIQFQLLEQNLFFHLLLFSLLWLLMLSIQVLMHSMPSYQCRDHKLPFQTETAAMLFEVLKER